MRYSFISDRIEKVHEFKYKLEISTLNKFSVLCLKLHEESMFLLIKPNVRQEPIFGPYYSKF